MHITLRVTRDWTLLHVCERICMLFRFSIDPSLQMRSHILLKKSMLPQVYFYFFTSDYPWKLKNSLRNIIFALCSWIYELIWSDLFFYIRWYYFVSSELNIVIAYFWTNFVNFPRKHHREINSLLLYSRWIIHFYSYRVNYNKTSAPQSC